MFLNQPSSSQRARTRALEARPDEARGARDARPHQADAGPALHWVEMKMCQSDVRFRFNRSIVEATETRTTNSHGPAPDHPHALPHGADAGAERAHHAAARVGRQGEVVARCGLRVL
jgi:hypothetical protein